MRSFPAPWVAAPWAGLGSLPEVACAAQEIIARQRKRKRRPERATDGTTYLPYRDSSGALRALQEVRGAIPSTSIIASGHCGVHGEL